MTEDASQFLTERVHDTVADVIRSWQNNPALAPLWQKFDQAQDMQQCLDAHAEAMIARHFMHQGYSVAVADTSIRDRGICLEVSRQDEGIPLQVHVRRMWTRGRTNDEVYALRPLQLLERIERPLLVRLHLNHYPSESDAEAVAAELTTFLETAESGARLHLYDKQGFELGRCDVTKTNYLPHVRLVKYVSFSNRDQSRLLEKLYDAYAHFDDTHGTNSIILVTSSWAQDIESLQPALQTFWARNQHPLSRAVGWFHTVPRHQNLQAFKLWLRNGEAQNPLLQRLASTNDTADLAPTN